MSKSKTRKRKRVKRPPAGQGATGQPQAETEVFDARDYLFSMPPEPPKPPEPEEVFDFRDYLLNGGDAG